ncbi:MAG: hypothetical protein U0324_38870 [Polyangiales bacterium]
MSLTSLFRPSRVLLALTLATLFHCTSDRVPDGQCEFNADCANGLVCANRYCRAPCRSDADCAAGARCVAGDNPGATACVPLPAGTPACQRDSDCAPGQACFDGLCRPQCQTSYDCQVVNPRSTCVAHRCVPGCAVFRADCDLVLSNGCEVNTQSDVRNCSACGRACPAGQVCSGGACRASGCAGAGETSCDGSCFNLQTDLANCGSCGHACPAGANASATCAAGVCGLTCNPGFGDCDGSASNGCEAPLSTGANCGACGVRCSGDTPTCAMGGGGAYACTAAACDGTLCGGACVNTQTDLANCGACGNACPAGPDSTASCEAGRCLLRCTDAARYADCDGNPRTGCEAAIATDAMNCGACGARCADRSNATGVCAGTACGITCAPGFGNCDGVEANGCEADTRADPTHCGACATACMAPANATATCAAGACGFTCNAGSADCDRAAANGCEVDTQSDRANCGACGRACAAGEVCSRGVCTSTCGAGETNCAGSCANLNTSEANCGACGRACANPANASASCAAGRCGFTCTAGFGDCDGNPANGCETSLLGSAASCGRCGNACAVPNAVAGCDAGRCVVGACNPGFADCDGAPANGCEVDTRSTPASCGACGRTCAPPNATAACASGACAIGRCNAGFADCDRNPANGCEVNTNTSTAHCGGCGAACSSAGGTASCAAGACGIACATGRGNCNMSAADGCEVDLNTAAANCGTCGRACALPNASAVCAAGACAVGTCNPGFGNCDGAAANGCEVNTTNTVAHCGGCGRACSLPNATAACGAGACVVAACNPGFADCDRNPANGCEVNLNTDPARCGACITACSTAGGTASCTAGACGIACAAGRGNCNGAVGDGCEVDLTTAVANCGACGAACALAHATPVCAAGSCAVGACAPGFLNCDGLAANGCEVNPQTDTANCGACGARCGAGQVCSLGVCTLVCGTGLTNCGGRCVALATDTANCGACGTACPARANAAATCAAGACGFACNPGFANCDGAAANGCEVNLNTDPAHCGACTTACSAAGGTASCTAGACGITCATGRGNCNGAVGDGCEVDTTASVANCGGCGSACSLPNATAACSASRCAVASCNAGFADCDGVAANGCEVNTNTSASNCGRCGNTCSLPNATAACSAGACAVAACTAPFGNCDGAAANGCEVDTSSTVAHCGGCGMACSANNGVPTCAAGACRIACTQTRSCPGFTCLFTADWGDCNGNPRADGCETNLLTTSNCGACGAACSFANASAICGAVGPACGLSACNAGFADCNAASSDGCEVNTTSDSANCGACGTSCAAATRANNYPHTCRTSVCRPANDACAAATPINLASGRDIWFEGFNTGATTDLVAPCQGGSQADVWYSFTLTQREVVYADTFGDGATHAAATWDTVLFLASSCTTAMTSPPANELYCDDDAALTGCSTGSNRSHVYAVLNPGTYYLALAGYSGNRGRAWVRFQHLPVGTSAIALSVNPLGSVPTITGTLAAGASQIAGTCGGAGTEVSYWWRTCPGDNQARYGRSLRASTCDARTAFDTVVYIRQSDPTQDQCIDDDGVTNCAAHSTSSTVGTRFVPDAGLHVVTVDAYASTVGFYVLNISWMDIIGALDPLHLLHRPRRPAPAPRRRAELGADRPRG